MEFFSLFSYYHHPIGINKKTKEISNFQKINHEKLDYFNIIAFKTNVETDSIFLVASNLETVMDLALSPIKSRIIRLKYKLLEDGCISLEVPSTNKYLCALLPHDLLGFGRIEGNRRNIGDWEKFRLKSIDITSEKIISLSYEVSKFINSLQNESSVINLIKSYDGDFGSYLLSLSLSFLSSDSIISISKKLSLDENLRADIARICPDDFWATQAIPSLVSWSNARAQNPFLTADSPSIQCSHIYDPLSELGIDGKTVSLAQICNYHIRKSISPRKELSILTCQRNEGIYLLEWIAWHRVLGVEWFYIYTNNNDDDSEYLLSALSQEGLITWINNEVKPGIKVQQKAYGHALNILPNILDYKWTILIDMDEFVIPNPEKFNNIRQYFEWQSQFNCDAIALNWKFLASSDVKDHDIFIPLTQRCTEFLSDAVIGEGTRLVKSAFKTSNIYHSNAHYPVVPDNELIGFRLTDNEPHRWNHPPAGEPASPAFSDYVMLDNIRVYHYFHKSAQEWFWKSCRNRGGDSTDMGADFALIEDGWIGNFMNQAKDNRVDKDGWVSSFAARHKKELDALRSIPRIAQAENLVRRKFSTRMQLLKNELKVKGMQNKLNEKNKDFINMIGL
ncbi:glycosyltransferase family 2 protein [Acetobacter senegalensis]|uniref:glycosyltransferase family 2 protein n=1 Tax=Acetobacter senegalensis TaxID=446692 RepID=UPI001EDA1ADD|nr:glycosyltransferase family 2 protein [Acetobacter senegalensis]MCG4252943.1 glycosyltransferase family 2 protein [Acetobacter senegalensis]